MPLTPHLRRRILWTSICCVGLLLLAYIVIPPAININYLKPGIEKAISEQTGINVNITGSINFSLLGATTIVAHNVNTPFGDIDRVSLSMPLRYIFNMQNAHLNSDIDVYGANIKITSLIPTNFNHNINVYNSNVFFINKEYKIIRANIIDRTFNGSIRTSQHKYDIAFNNGNFVVKNNNNNLEITGQIYSDGTARGELHIETDDINRWFEFSEPKIDKHVSATMNFDWDGEYGFDFTDIHANGTIGNITLKPDGHKVIHLASNNLTYDLSFLTKPNKFFYNTDLDLDFYGDMPLNKHHFKHLKVQTSGKDEHIDISNITADNISLQNGYIDTDGGHDITLVINRNNNITQCLFNGTPEIWECSKFTYKNISGTLNINNNTFTASITSPDDMPNIETLQNAVATLGSQGTIKFSFANKSGDLLITPDTITPQFTFATDVSLQDVNIYFGFLPPFMMTTKGELTTTDGTLTFIPSDKNWTLSVSQKSFHITGTNLKLWLQHPDDLKFMNDLPYAVSGIYDNGYISNLTFILAEQIFTGTSNKDTITLSTNELNLDKFINQNFMQNFEEQSFLSQHPVISMFDIPFNISISAKKLIFNDIEYNNFIYSLKRDSQTISITDSDRGNLLTTIEKHKNDYNINIQLNKFLQDGGILTYDMPINTYNSTITGNAKFKTFGNIAEDILYNLSGDIDVTFNGGDFIGFGIDDFYASSETIGTLNAEFAISKALNGGISHLKELRIIGRYEHGQFSTTKPFTLSLRHADITGALDISDTNINGLFQITLRGTSPDPTPIDVKLDTNNLRTYSLSEIMTNFDPDYMRTFVQTHNQF
ncbi:MAG: hypothetical protein KBS86_02675 [Proteobacteria bacterium]|nr:hypothetical protein [Candidatus Enterousia scatequi]